MLQDKPPDLKRVAQFRQGYAVHQVDALVSRVRAQLRTVRAQHDGPSELSAADLDPGALQTMSGGYRRSDVEQYLADATTTLFPAAVPAASARSATTTENDPDANGRDAPSESLRNPVFHRPTLGRHGYETGSVDYIVSLIARGLDGSVEMTGAQLARVTFNRSPTRSLGYDETEVDGYLDAVIAELDRRAAGG